MLFALRENRDVSPRPPTDVSPLPDGLNRFSRASRHDAFWLRTAESFVAFADELTAGTQPRTGTWMCPRSSVLLVSRRFGRSSSSFSHPLFLDSGATGVEWLQ